MAENGKWQMPGEDPENGAPVLPYGPSVSRAPIGSGLRSGACPQSPFFSTNNTISFPFSACCEGSSFRAPVKNSILRLPIGPQKHARRYRSAFRRL
ncbi:uncharacterized protein AtWU_00947 [Aspergillus tubingensis]|uniref:uncharacterized protein n=1 Tax=Aspergillus tubingensis TaxID=5068 RepID=UPI001578E5C9|nr:uncharacterized protein AtWU_00947 [Aspergillus tubingensis]GFN11151.1 hypothetical protein AtWU_00947 [Aspergillus tubingensis]